MRLRSLLGEKTGRATIGLSAGSWNKKKTICRILRDFRFFKLDLKYCPVDPMIGAEKLLDGRRNGVSENRSDYSTGFLGRSFFEGGEL